MCGLGGVGPGTVVYDLGSGAGRLLVAAAARGARAVGLESDPFKVVQALIAVRAAGAEALASVRWADHRTADLSEADVVFVYLTAGGMAGLRASLRPRLRPGALVVSNRFRFPGLEPCAVDEAHAVYAYRAPL